VTRTLLLLGKPECHLCHEMAAVARAVVRPPLELIEQDVRSRDEWQLYRTEIPVLLCGDVEIARHRITKAELEQRLRSLGLA
jgi:hypothetical protein